MNAGLQQYPPLLDFTSDHLCFPPALPAPSLATIQSTAVWYVEFKGFLSLQVPLGVPGAGGRPETAMMGWL